MMYLYPEEEDTYRIWEEAFLIFAVPGDFFNIMSFHFLWNRSFLLPFTVSIQSNSIYYNSVILSNLAYG